VGKVKRNEGEVCVVKIVFSVEDIIRTIGCSAFSSSPGLPFASNKNNDSKKKKVEEEAGSKSVSYLLKWNSFTLFL
jgi:hypothetical protein